MVLTSSLMVLRVVVTMWGDSGWQLDLRYVGRVGKEARDTLWLVAGFVVDILMLDIIVVVLAEGIDTEIRMFERVSMSQIAASSRDEIVELVCCEQQVAN
jgi:hypothetical protein